VRQLRAVSAVSAPKDYRFEAEAEMEELQVPSVAAWIARIFNRLRGAKKSR